ncbi:MAG: isoprenylcysteine carboxylmethyltransferase family protein [Candidatus Eremiobacteraeota bacterium]|nr:isoprenylcysteine carboxylmethyltransferase family protein [Candidatus Eremiobacteraeota bacterium]
MRHYDEDDSDTPGVCGPPPLIFIAALGLGLALGRGTASDTRGSQVSRFLGTAAIPAGVLLGAAAIVALKGAGTNLDPFKPSTALVTRGPFRFTRNPAYVGATSIYIGIALLARSLPALTLLPVALALLDRGVVDREERYLERRFGDAYRSYRATVPRWF